MFSGVRWQEGSVEPSYRSIASSSSFRNLAGLSSARRISDDDDEDEEGEIYREKYHKVKKFAKGLIFENASLCDEVSRLQEKIVIAKEERRFLLRKLLNFEAQKEKDASSLPNAATSGLALNKAGVMENVELQSKKKSAKKRKPSEKPPTDEAAKSRNKRRKTPTEKKEKKIVQPIPLDYSGRPIFPIILRNFTLHSLGVIIHDRPGFHDVNTIFPVGYCSSRTYMSLRNPPGPCLYTCTIMDSSFGPRFEIIPEDNPEHPFVSGQLNECHSYLLKSVNALCGREMLVTEGQGAQFFGLSHPTVQNLIQSCAGARKCCNYRWVQFEVSKQRTDDASDKLTDEDDPVINYNSLQILLTESA